MEQVPQECLILTDRCQLGDYARIEFMGVLWSKVAQPLPFQPTPQRLDGNQPPPAEPIGIYTAIFAATPWGDGSRRSGADLHRCRSYLSIRGRPRPQSLVSQGLRI